MTTQDKASISADSEFPAAADEITGDTASQTRAALSRRLLIFLPFAALALNSCKRREGGRQFVGYGAWERGDGE